MDLNDKAFEINSPEKVAEKNPVQAINEVFDRLLCQDIEISAISEGEENGKNISIIK